MKVLAKVTLVVSKKEYAPDTEVEIPDVKEAESLIERGFAMRIVKDEDRAAPPAGTSSTKQGNQQKTDKNAQKGAKSAPNIPKNNENNPKEIDNSGTTVSKSGGSSV